MSEISFTANGKDPVSYVLRLAESARTTVADMLTVGLAWRTRIVEKTQAGVDVDGNPFVPYSEKGPFYYSPTGQAATGTVPHDKQRASVKRLFGKVQRAGGTSVSGVRISRTGRSIVFPSYGAFKRWLGRTNVDLFGPRAPHMMASIVVRAGYSETRAPGDNSPSDSASPADTLTIGIYGEPAARAEGHQYGTRHLPQRRFLGADQAMMDEAKALISERIRARLMDASK